MSSVISSNPQRRSASRAPGPEFDRIPALSPLPRTAANQSTSGWSREPTYQRQ